MEESARLARNRGKLAECYPAFAERLTGVLTALERRGFRPRIQEAYRSPADQRRAYEAGTSHLLYGLHNATGPDGRREALAADVLDDDHPTAPPARYLLALAVAAGDFGVGTGILWGLPAGEKTRTAAAVRDRRIDAKVQVGWDPTHVQTVGLTAAQVRAGARPGTSLPPSEEDSMALTDEQAESLESVRRMLIDLTRPRKPDGTDPDLAHVSVPDVYAAARQATEAAKAAGVAADLARVAAERAETAALSGGRVGADAVIDRLKERL